MSGKYLKGVPSKDFSHVSMDDDRDLAVELDRGSKSHLFRHASELTRESKGGYLVGRIRLPPTTTTTEDYYLRVSLVPAFVDRECNPFHLHPSLLHINSGRKTRRGTKRKAEEVRGTLPPNIDWCLTFRVAGNDVYRLKAADEDKERARFVERRGATLASHCRYEEAGKEELRQHISEVCCGENPLNIGRLRLPHDYTEEKVASLTTNDHDTFLPLGTDAGLRINIVAPLQKFSKHGTNICDVLQQRYLDLYGRSITSTTLERVESLYTKEKLDKVKQEQVMLLAELFNTDGQLTFRASAISDVINNSKSKECGPLQLHESFPRHACCNAETKVILLSYFKLSTDVKANFVLWNPAIHDKVYDHDDLFHKIRQPLESTVFNQTVIICKVPPQNPEVIQEIKDCGFKLRISAFRKSDNKMSCSSFPFEYYTTILYITPSHEATDQCSDQLDSGSDTIPDIVLDADFLSATLNVAIDDTLTDEFMDELLAIDEN